MSNIGGLTGVGGPGQTGSMSHHTSVNLGAKGARNMSNGSTGNASAAW